MMKKIQLIFLTTFLLLTGLTLAQSNNDKARAYFTQAKSAFATDNYTKTIEYLSSAEDLLGATNPVILNLKVKAYYNLKQFDNAKKALDKFSKVRSKADAGLVDETLSYLIKINKDIQYEIDRKENLRLAEIEKIKKIELLKDKEIAEKVEFFEFYKREYGDSNKNITYNVTDIYGNKKYGVVSSDFEVLIDYRFDILIDQKEGLYFTKVNNNGNHRYGLIDVLKGEELISPKWESIHSFSEGTASVEINDKWVLIARNGNEVSPKSDDKFNFNNDYSIFSSKGKKGLINSQGKIIIYPKYSFMYLYKEGYVSVSLTKYKTVTYRRSNYDGDATVNGLLNMDGEIIIPIDQISANFKIFADDEVIIVTQNPLKSRYGIIYSEDALYSTNGQLLRSFSSTEIGDFVDGMATIEIKGKLGFINKKGVLSVPCKYSSVYPFNNGIAKVSKKGKGKWIYINKQGEVID